MKNLKKLGALLLVLVLMFSLSANAFADVTIGTGNETVAGNGAAGDGEIGGYVDSDPDVQTVDDKAVVLKKEITAYNPDEAYIYGPAITYTYAIAAASGTELVTITDEAADHTSGIATKATALGGITTGVVVTGSGTGVTTGTPDIVWDNADILEASANGTANYKTLKLDFTNVVFTAPGVYRYKITETATYTNTGVTDGDITAIRYLDVYVMRSSTFNPTHDGTSGHEFVAGDWKVYGFVCVNSTVGTTAITPSTAATTEKTNGFVDTNTAADASTADQYYTYNFTVSKDLLNDNTMINHQFPMTVEFTGGPTGTFQLIAETDGTHSTLTTTTVAAGAATVNSTTGIPGAAATNAAILKVGGAAALSAFANAGAPKVADGNATANATTGFIKYIGIPNTAIVSVTETNDVVGTTYTVKAKEDDTTNDASALAAVDLTATSNANGLVGTPKAASVSYNETAKRTAATGNAADALGKNIDIQIINDLAIISPTGVAFRVAPYALMLGFGIAILVISRRRREEEEEPALA